MTRREVSANGQVTLGRDLMMHLGIRPGERVEVEALPGGVSRIRAARPGRTTEEFLHSLDGKVTSGEPLSIDDINRITAAGWAGS
jgi:hypothetical protein